MRDVSVRPHDLSRYDEIGNVSERSRIAAKCGFRVVRDAASISFPRPHTQTVVVPDAGIMVMDDKPGEVDAAIGTFLQRAASRPSAAPATRPR